MNKKWVGLGAVAILLTGALLARRFWIRDFPYAGTIEATKIELPARVATVVDAIEVGEGEKVRKGQKLVSLACEELRISSRHTDEDFTRAERLRRAEAISQEAYDSIRSRKQETDTRLSWCQISSPVDGVVLDRYLEPSEWVNPGSKILSVADLQNLWAYVFVPTEVMAHLKVGQAVRGVIPELSGRSFEGVISKVNEEAEFTPKNVQTQAERTRLVFGIKVAFNNPDGLIKPGMTMEVVFPE